MDPKGPAPISYSPSGSGQGSPRASGTPERWDDIGPLRIHLSSLQLAHQLSHQQTKESIKDLQTKLDNVANQVAKRNPYPQCEPESVQLEMLNDLKSQQTAILKQVESRHAEVQSWQADMQKRIESQHSELLAAIQNQQTAEDDRREAQHRYQQHMIKFKIFRCAKRRNVGLATLVLFLCLPLVAILIYQVTTKPVFLQAVDPDDSLSWLHAGAFVEWNPMAGKEPKDHLKESDWIEVTIIDKDKENDNGVMTYSIRRGGLRTHAKPEEFRQRQPRTDT